MSDGVKHMFCDALLIFTWTVGSCRGTVCVHWLLFAFFNWYLHSSGNLPHNAGNGQNVDCEKGNSRKPRGESSAGGLAKSKEFALQPMRTANLHTWLSGSFFISDIKWVFFCKKSYFLLSLLRKPITSFSLQGSASQLSQQQYVICPQAFQATEYWGHHRSGSDPYEGRHPGSQALPSGDQR